MNYKERLLSDKFLENVTVEKITPNKTLTDVDSNEISMSSYDTTLLKSIVADEYGKRGIKIEDIAAMSTTSLVTQGLMSLYSRVENIINTSNRESSLLTAQGMASLYNMVVQHTDDIELSKPSKLEMFVKIFYSEVKKHGVISGVSKWKFVYSTKNEVLIDGLQFIPEFDVDLNLVSTNSREELTVQYPYSDGFKTIPVQKSYDSVTGEAYGIFKMQFIQISVTTEERTFTGNEIERFIFTNEFPIHDFIIMYKDSTTTNPIPLAGKLYYTRGTENYLQYKIHNSRKMSIEYVYTPNGFKPLAGGTLQMTMLGTSGYDVKFRDKAIIKTRHPSNLVLEYLPVGEEFVSSGGKINNDDKEYIRNYVRKLKGSRLRIDTEEDLKIFLGVYQGASTFLPKMVVNDIKSRIFNIYTTLSFTSNSYNFTVPTTSGDILIDPSILPKRTLNGETIYAIANSNIHITSTFSGAETVFIAKAGAEPVTPGDNINVFNYKIPFVLGYNENENYIRCLAESQYNTPFPTFVSELGEYEDIPTRFVNTNLRMNDFEEEVTDALTGEVTNVRRFSISTDIRNDVSDFKVDKDVNFSADIIITNTDDRKVIVPLSRVFHGTGSTSTLEFDLVSDRNVYDRYFELTGVTSPKAIDPDDTPWVEETTLCDMHQTKVDMRLNYITPEGVTELVSVYTAEMEIFKDISQYMHMQSLMDMTSGNLRLLLCPLIELDFFKSWRNREHINKELNSIFTMLSSEIYDFTTSYSPNGYSLSDRLETLFTTSIKFVKTHGRSKFLALSDVMPIMNLQLSPRMQYRLIEESFNLNIISDALNQSITNHDFISKDFHANELVSKILVSNKNSVAILQFIDFGDGYGDTEHLIYHNDARFLNEDVPEKVSVKSRWNTDLSIYEYDLSYVKI